MDAIKDLVCVTDLNTKLANFTYGRHDRENKVSNNFYTDKSTEKTYGFKISATNMWTLVRIFPFIFGEKLEKNIYYLHFLSLLEIFKTLLSDRFTENMVQNLENNIYVI